MCCIIMIGKVLFIPNSKHTETATAACMLSNIVAFGSSALLNLIAAIYRQTNNISRLIYQII